MLNENGWMSCRNCGRIFRLKDINWKSFEGIKCPRCSAKENIYMANEYEIPKVEIK
jgi:phage FluMu protein Com